MSIKKSKSALKRYKQNEKRRLLNRIYSTRIKTTAKKILSLLNEKQKEQAQKEFCNFSSYLQKAAQKGLLHKNTAARKQSRMQKKINSLT